MAKPLWDSTSMGIEFIPDPAALDRYLAARPAAHAVLEKCLGGRLCSVDIVGAGGHYTVMPLIRTGTAGGPPAFTFDDLRYARPAPDDDFVSTAQRLVGLCTELGVEGSANVDMIHADGVYHVLEINPRIGGATTLSIAAGGLDTFTALLDILDGTWPTRTSAPADRFAIECLTANPPRAARRTPHRCRPRHLPRPDHRRPRPRRHPHVHRGTRRRTAGGEGTRRVVRADRLHPGPHARQDPPPADLRRPVALPTGGRPAGRGDLPGRSRSHSRSRSRSRRLRALPRAKSLRGAVASPLWAIEGPRRPRLRVARRQAPCQSD
ncbi:ATP-grasp domain-containing protein [Streptomyces sp. Caat 7-52]|uniref:ATP-grasp domain-containing protein n=1 Tax=Streptomyces sp. Caat 7-52 TaxID=2949637 RepID=UPI00203641A9|nr:ATP-grasp domain-containing protein [Streptomyces sp. Caat 7-52]